MIKVNITTLGCPKNVADSGHLKKSLMQEGLLHVDEPEDADLLIVNTCGFIKAAKEESIEEILRLAEIKERRTDKGRGQKKKLFVLGCLAKRYLEELRSQIPEIDNIWGVGEEDSIIEYCKDHLTKDAALWPAKNIRTQAARSQSSVATSYAYLKIAEGCDKRCTFCVIPSIRGRFRSLQPEEILKEAEYHIHSGVRELILVAQDITNYGKELRGYKLVSLLKDMISIRGDFHIRLLYLYPTMIDDQLLECMANEDKIVNYLDIPLQHSEDRILRLMGRRGTKKEYHKLMRNIRRAVPGVAIRTTFIAGFPTETEEDFNGLVEFIEEMRFDRLGVFKYSREEGTPASTLKGQIPEKVKDRRLDEIMTRQALISLEKNRDLIGKTYPAVIDEVDDDVVLARLYSHAPEIDGMVIINRREGARHKEHSIGEIVRVEITDAFDYDLKGKIIDNVGPRSAEAKINHRLRTGHTK
ncbi:MAG: 30S ribosomal protein S12 methylthiotransferase RimO [Dissulfurispiraceae bacterium]